MKLAKAFAYIMLREFIRVNAWKCYSAPRMLREKWRRTEEWMCNDL